MIFFKHRVMSKNITKWDGGSIGLLTAEWTADQHG